jgi:hypothetical protein
MEIPLELSLEQQFNLKSYEQSIKTMSQAEAQDCLLQVLRQLMVKENIIKHLMQKR